MYGIFLCDVRNALGDDVCYLFVANSHHLYTFVITRVIKMIESAKFTGGHSRNMLLLQKFSFDNKMFILSSFKKLRTVHAF